MDVFQPAVVEEGSVRESHDDALRPKEDEFLWE